MRDAELQLVDELVCSRNWRAAAACRDEDPELFFPLGQGAAYAAQVAEAKAVCAGCPVRARCLQDALDRGIGDGVFGGLDEDERRALKRRQARPQQPHRKGSKRLQPVDQVDVEDCLRGLPVVLNGAEKREAARRLFAAGRSRTAISQALHLSGTTVNEFLRDDFPRDEKQAVRCANPGCDGVPPPRATRRWRYCSAGCRLAVQRAHRSATGPAGEAAAS